MKANTTIYFGVLLALIFSSCERFLDRPPFDKHSYDDYWTSESAMRSYAQDFYSNFFFGYGADYTVFGGYFSGDNYTDDFLTLGGGYRTFPVTAKTDINAVTGTWSTGYDIVFKANAMMAKIPDSPISEEAKNHWMGVARFFRAMAYSDMAMAYGGVPYIDRVLVPSDPKDRDELFKDRDPYLYVAKKILEDYEFALKNVRADDGKLQVNKYVVGAYMSRDMLYHATWLKYHGSTVGPTSQKIPDAELKTLFQGAIDGAQVVMNSGNFHIGNSYNAIFTTDVLPADPDIAGEVVFYREYTDGVSTNALMSYNATENINHLGSVTQNVIESYLCIDGLPIGQSPLYKGSQDPSIRYSFQNRDPRLYDTVVDTLRIFNSGLHPAGASPTGYAPKKFLNEAWLAAESPFTKNNRSPADAPTIRYAEVLLNYVEARYEISRVGGAPFTQNDLDLSVNQLRDRKLVKWGESKDMARSMPRMVLAGNGITADGILINDPARDPDVDPVLWELRRERRVELIMEGRRGDDLRRWAKYKYLNSEDEMGNPDMTFLGAFIKVSDYPGIKTGENGVRLFNPKDPGNSNPNEGYIWRLTQKNVRVFKEGDLNYERYYLRAIPDNQLTKYKDNGYQLTQNPGW